MSIWFFLTVAALIVVIGLLWLSYQAVHSEPATTDEDTQQTPCVLELEMEPEADEEVTRELPAVHDA